MQAVKVLPKGQITLPKNVRKKLGIKPGDSLIIQEDKEKIVLKKGKTIYDYIGTLPKPDIPMEEMIEKATEEAIRERV
jgi:AbrB family looped-hinge helix DNA binding protein